jgi:hypothetical protein
MRNRYNGKKKCQDRKQNTSTTLYINHQRTYILIEKEKSKKVSLLRRAIHTCCEKRRKIDYMN